MIAAIATRAIVNDTDIDPTDIDNYVNAYDINFRTTKSGSIKKTIFFDYIIHYIKHLHKGYGGPTG